MSNIIKEIAEKEVREEIFRSDVEKEKDAIRKRIQGIRWWHLFMPFKITIKIERR